MVLFLVGPVTIIQAIFVCLKCYQRVKKFMMSTESTREDNEEILPKPSGLELEEKLSKPSNVELEEKLSKPPNLELEEKPPKPSGVKLGCGCCRRCTIYAQLGPAPVKPFIECDKHTSYLCAFGCLECNIPICLKCKQQDHNKHTVGDLFELDEAATPSVKSKPRKPYLLRDMPLKTSGVESEVHKGYDLVRNQAKEQAKTLHTMIDNLLQAALDSADEMEFRDLEILERLGKEVKSATHDSCSGWSGEERDDQEMKVGNKESSLSEILYERENDHEMKDGNKESSPSEILHLRAPRFLQGLPSIREMKAQFGIIKPGVVDRRYRPKEMLSKPILLSTIDSLSKYTLYVRYFHSNMILQSGTGPEVHVLNEKGNCLETIHITSGIDMPTGLAIAEDGTILYTDFSHRRIRKIKTDRTIEILIITEGKPNGICCTRSGNIIVCLQDCPQTEGKVVWYNHDGDKLHEFTDDYLKGPTSVYENINSDVCITEESMRKVIVVDKDSVVRFMYDGNLDAGNVTKFTPRDICCDSVGHILIADFSNRLIHMINEDGQFVRYLLTKEDDLSYPHGICVDAGNRLWVAERFSKKIKVYQYFES